MTAGEQHDQRQYHSLALCIFQTLPKACLHPGPRFITSCLELSFPLLRVEEVLLFDVAEEAGTPLSTRDRMCSPSVQAGPSGLSWPLGKWEDLLVASCAGGQARPGKKAQGP